MSLTALVPLLGRFRRIYRTENLYYRNRHRIPTREPEEIFPGLFEKPALLASAMRGAGSPTTLELYVLASLVRYVQPVSLFEFGTFEGRTTLHLALNSPQGAVVQTIDLRDGCSTTKYSRAYPDEANARRLPVGAFFQGCPQGGKIRQLFGDSASGNYTDLRGKVDFVFVDGDHGYAYVKSDSEHALAMVSPRGLVVWHDYDAIWGDVPRYLVELSRQRGLYHLAGTSLVVHGPSLQVPTLEAMIDNPA